MKYLPAKIGLTALRVKKLERDEAVLVTVEGGLEFRLPRELLPADIAEGEFLNLKILEQASAAEPRDEFARQMLEEMIN